jgi:hypothetical protein
MEIAESLNSDMRRPRIEARFAIVSAAYLGGLALSASLGT